MEFLECWFYFYLIFWGPFLLFFTVAAPIYNPTKSMCTRDPFSTRPRQHLLSCYFDASRSNKCEVISRCGFDLHFSNDQWQVHFMRLLTIWLFSLEKMFIKAFCPFLIRLFGFLQMSYMGSLYILDVKPLWDRHIICKYFLWLHQLPFHVERWLFVVDYFFVIRSFYNCAFFYC